MNSSDNYCARCSELLRAVDEADDDDYGDLPNDEVWLVVVLNFDFHTRDDAVDVACPMTSRTLSDCLKLRNYQRYFFVFIMKFLSYFLSYFSLCLLVVNFPHFPHSQWRYCSDLVLASGLSLFVDVHEILMDHHCLQRLFFVLWHFLWHNPVATATNWKSFTLIKFVIFILMLLIFFEWKWLFSPSNTRDPINTKEKREHFQQRNSVPRRW